MHALADELQKSCTKQVDMMPQHDYRTKVSIPNLPIVPVVPNPVGLMLNSHLKWRR